VNCDPQRIQHSFLDLSRVNIVIQDMTFVVLVPIEPTAIAHVQSLTNVHTKLIGRIIRRRIAEREAAKYSGKLSLRMSRSLHRDLSEMAKREGVSLNQLATTILARAAGE
jgi:HicB family